MAEMILGAISVIFYSTQFPEVKYKYKYDIFVTLI